MLWEFVGGLAERGTTVIYSTHNVGEAEHYADRVLVLADGELLFTGTPAELRAAAPTHFEAAFVAFLHEQGPLMRWLLLKDLQILRRSPLLLATLVLYPVAARGARRRRASTPGPSKPQGRVPQRGPGREERGLDRRRAVDASKYADQIFEAIDPMRGQDARGGARGRRVRPRASRALIVPEDITDRLQAPAA